MANRLLVKVAGFEPAHRGGVYPPLDSLATDSALEGLREYLRGPSELDSCESLLLEWTGRSEERGKTL